MPQMMPCSWLLIFFSGMLVFLVINSNWSSFFFISSFPGEKEESLSDKKVVFWV